MSDISSKTGRKLKPCSPGKVRNPLTNRCRKANEKNSIRTALTNKPTRHRSSPPPEKKTAGRGLEKSPAEHGEVPRVYLVLVGERLANPPPEWILMSSLPKEEALLQFWGEGENRHVYSLPVVSNMMKLFLRWYPLGNEKHGNSEFEDELTKVEKEYLDLATKKNPDVDWDTTGKWSLGVLDYGVGAVGTGNIKGTLVIGFTNSL